jgi:hypothetical protein
MNMTRWDRLNSGDKRRLFAAIARVIENREMPPSRYVFLQPEARLTTDQAVAIIEWTRAERRRLRELRGRKRAAPATPTPAPPSGESLSSPRRSALRWP